MELDILSHDYLRLIERLRKHYAVHAGNTLSIQLIKMQEELGEVAEAFIGANGLNPRKGVTHTQDDLNMELADVVITAVLALRMSTGSSVAVNEILRRQALKTIGRLEEFDQRSPTGTKFIDDGATTPAH